MLSCQEMPKYILLMCGLIALSVALPEKCSKKPHYSENQFSSILEILAAHSMLDVNFDQCRDYNYECQNLSEEEFMEVLDVLPVTCQQTCKLNGTEKPICDYFQGLRLISSPIFKLPANSFQHFDALTYLFIENTSIIDIGDNVFYNLTNLKFLSLANNRIRWIADSTFRDLPMLTKLSLQNNHLESFKMINLPLIETLILEDNRLESIKLEDLVSLKTLSLKHNQLKGIKNSFTNLDSLSSLILEYNHLEQISVVDLKGLHSLILLDISHNKIKSIEANAFSEMEGLHTLHLEDNFLTKMPGNMFANNMNLGILTLANNHLTHLDANLLHGLRQLFFLDLDNNAISDINPETFGIHSAIEKHSPADIWVVRLHNNRLQKLDLTIFRHINTLHLNVSNNQLKSLNMDQLSCDIDASFNNIEQLLGGEATNSESRLGSITDIRLSHNRIQNIRSGLFGRFSKLENLTLDNNQITNLPLGIFDSLHSLTYLNLNSNELDSCPPVVFADLPRLETLIMSNNSLQSLEMDKMLKELPELKTFDIDSNKWECSYLQKILFSDTVRSRKGLSFKSNQYRKRSTSLHSIKGVSCSDSNDGNVTSEKEKQNSKNESDEIYEKIIKLLEERNPQNGKLTAESSAVVDKEDLSKYEDHFSGIKSGIIVLIIFVVLISLFSVYNLYENRRWRQQSGMHRMSLNTMMEDI